MGLEGESLYNVAAGLGFIAYLMTNVLWLRLLLVVGAAVYIAAGLVLGIDSMIGWHVAYSLINLVQIVLLLLDRRTTGLPERVRVLYSDRFSSIKPREFRRLIETNREQSSGPGKLLNEGDENGRLMLITDGELQVVKHGLEVYRLRSGDFVGELSIISGKPVNADVIASSDYRYVYWDNQDLSRLEARNLSLYNRFMMSVGRNIIEKLHTSTESQKSIQELL